MKKILPSGLETRDSYRLLSSVIAPRPIAFVSTVNKNGVPNDSRPPKVTSGIRLGSPALTTRGFREPEMALVAGLIDRVLDSSGDTAVCEQTRNEIKALCEAFPMPGHAAAAAARER